MAAETPEPPAVLARIPKDAEEDLVLRRNTHDGRAFVDLRTFTADRSGKRGLPQAAGLCLSPAKWRELLPLLQAAIEGD